jgi:Ca2+-binding EF-hand superfamily protein
MKKLKAILPLALIAMVGLSPVVVAGDADTAKRQAYFNKWDADGDGQLNITEFTAMVTAQFAKKGKPDAEAEAAKRFKRKDADGDGFISFDEFNQQKKGM